MSEKNYYDQPVRITTAEVSLALNLLGNREVGLKDIATQKAAATLIEAVEQGMEVPGAGGPFVEFHPEVDCTIIIPDSLVVYPPNADLPTRHMVVVLKVGLD